jgi:NitT/TauT family transport system substrate-binding protein
MFYKFHTISRVGRIQPSRPGRVQPSCLLVLLLTSGLLTACSSSKSEPDQVSVRLKWLHQAQFAGLYVAQQEGYYDDENLAVTFDTVDFGQQISTDKVLAGENDFGIAAAEEIVIARSEGKPVRALAVIFRISADVLLVTPELGIQSPYDFVGQKVALSPGGPTIIYTAMMEQLGIDRSQIEEIAVTTWDLWECWEVAPVCPNYATNGPVILDLSGEDYTLIWPSDYGISWYGDVLFTTDQMIAEQPEVVERFVRTTLRGWQAAIEDLELAVSATLTYDDQLDENFQRQAMLASVPLIDTGDTLIGTMDGSVWQSIQDTLLEQGLISSPVDLDTLYTNEYVEKAQ